jgi:hypothetical protein
MNKHKKQIALGTAVISFIAYNFLSGYFEAKGYNFAQNNEPREELPAVVHIPITKEKGTKEKGTEYFIESSKPALKSHPTQPETF